MDLGKQARKDRRSFSPKPLLRIEIVTQARRLKINDDILIPGTMDQFQPSWRQKATVKTDAVLTQVPFFQVCNVKFFSFVLRRTLGGSAMNSPAVSLNVALITPTM